MAIRIKMKCDVKNTSKVNLSVIQAEGTEHPNLGSELIIETTDKTVSDIFKEGEIYNVIVNQSEEE